VITRKDGTESLNGRHTGFGKVIEGMDIAEKIQAVPRDKSDKPNTNVVIKKAYVTKR
jgi:cyclophilin family peptidyl-prolyl cis-trans isomerase